MVSATHGFQTLQKQWFQQFMALPEHETIVPVVLCHKHLLRCNKKKQKQMPAAYFQMTKWLAMLLERVKWFIWFIWSYGSYGSYDRVRLPGPDGLVSRLDTSVCLGIVARRWFRQWRVFLNVLHFMAQPLSFSFCVKSRTKNNWG